MIHCKSLFQLICFVVLPLITFSQGTDKLAEIELLVKNEKFVEAGKKLEQSWNDFPKSERLYLLRGRIRIYGEKNFSGALEDYNEAIKLNGTSSEGYFFRSQLFAAADIFSEAKNDLSMALRYATTDSMKVEILLYRSGANLATANYQAVLVDCREAYALDSVNPKVMNNMAMSFNRLGEYDSALIFLNRMLLYDSTNFAPYMNIGFVMITKGKYDEAIPWLEKALTLQNKQPYIWNNLAYAKLKTGKTKEALTNVNKSIALDASNSYAFRNRGLIYLELQKKEEACQDFTKAIELGFRERFGKEVDDLKEQHCKN